MNLSFRIAWRYFISRRKSGAYNAVSLISWISLAGYLVGAAALVIVLSVFNGFGSLFGTMYAQFDADLKITPAKGKTFIPTEIPFQKIADLKGISSAEWVIEENVLMRYNNKQGIGTIRAVSENYIANSHLDTNILRGAAITQSGDTNYAIVGLGLSYQLGIDPDDQFHYLGIYLPRSGEVDMLNPDGAFAKGVISPSAIFSIQEEVDAKYVLVPLRFAQENLERGNQFSSIEIRLNKDEDLDQFQENIQEICGPNFEVKNRFEQRASFYKIMQSEKTISYVILVFILLIAAFNTIGSLYMLVLEKKTDLINLKGMGLKPKQAFRLFLFESLLIAVVGGFVGILLGAVFVIGQEKFGWVSLQNAESFVINSYPVKLQVMDLVNVFFTLIILGLITAIYPASKAAKIVSQEMRK
jgi:lipoprotein-releasing system permease protein